MKGSGGEGAEAPEHLLFVPSLASSFRSWLSQMMQILMVSTPAGESDRGGKDAMADEGGGPEDPSADH